MGMTAMTAMMAVMAVTAVMAVSVDAHIGRWLMIVRESAVHIGAHVQK